MTASNIGTVGRQDGVETDKRHRCLSETAVRQKRYEPGQLTVAANGKPDTRAGGSSQFASLVQKERADEQTYVILTAETAHLSRDFCLSAGVSEHVDALRALLGRQLAERRVEERQGLWR